jgi:hypothetical protein
MLYVLHLDDTFSTLCGRDLGKHNWMCIVIGPNPGRKTTYVQMVGLYQLLAQLSVWSTAAHARLSSVDTIYTYYPSVPPPGLLGTSSP